MAGIQIQSLPTASTLTGSELAVVSQNNVTKKTTIEDINAAPLAAASDALIAANDAASDAATALSTANTAQSTANTAQSTANSAQSTANGKLSTVSVDGTTITGNGTSGNPLVASVPTLYQVISLVDFQTLQGANGLVAGKSYLVTGAWTAATNVFGADKNVMVTASTINQVLGTCWVQVLNIDSSQPFFLKASIGAAGNFSFMVLTEHSRSVPLTPAQCGNLKFSFDYGTKIYIRQASNQILITEISGNNNNAFNSKEVKRITLDSVTAFGSYDYTTDTFTPNPVATTPPKEYRGYLTISGGGITFTSLQNDVGTIVWTNPSNGVLWGTLNGAFLSAKFWGIGGTLNGGNVPYFTDIQRFTDNIITVSIFKYDGFQTGTPFGTFPIHLIINN